MNDIVITEFNAELRKIASINFARSLGGHALMGAGVGGAAGAAGGVSQGGGLGGAVRGGLAGAGIGAAGGVALGRHQAGLARTARQGKMVEKALPEGAYQRFLSSDHAPSDALRARSDNWLDKKLKKNPKGKEVEELRAKARGGLEGTEEYDRLYQPFWSE
jgi:hypothetical protein